MNAAETKQFIQAQLMLNLTRKDALDMVRSAQNAAAFARALERRPGEYPEYIHELLSLLKSIDDSLAQALQILEAQP